MYDYKAKIIKVVDGDTIWADIDLGFDITVRRKIRLAGIDAPELSTQEGKECSAYLKEVLPPDKDIVLISKKTLDKYGRFVAVIYTDAYRNINAEMVATGRAKYKEY